jgi:hypothetical protein
VSVAFVSRAPSPDEAARLGLALSTFCDGSGMTRLADGSTLPGWREVERVVAEILGGHGAENKGIFDVMVPSTTHANVDYGFSIKSKELSRVTAIGDLDSGGRVYMELANSPAKFWAALKAEGISEDAIRNKREAARIGSIILGVVQGWHAEAARLHQSVTGRPLDLKGSVFLCLSYSKARVQRPREYQWHSFALDFPPGIQWEYRSEKSLLGRDPSSPSEVLIDWYPLSGGQLKYYPRAKTARFRSERFTLASEARALKISEKAARYWPKEWVAAGGTTKLRSDEIVRELESLAALAESPEAGEILLACARDIKQQKAVAEAQRAEPR